MGHPLARAFTILGIDNPYFGSEAISQLLEREGQEFTAAKRPKGMRRGKPNNCYANASKLVLEQYMTGGTALRYVEGLVHLEGSPFALLHGWAVTADGTVVDPTLKDPRKYRYFGVIHDTEALRLHTVRHRVWGILGGDSKAAAEWLQAKGIDPRAVDPRWAAVWEKLQALPDPSSPEL